MTAEIRNPANTPPERGDLGVTDIQVERATLTYRTPINTGRGILERRNVVVLTVRDDDGHEGRGEAAPLAGFTPETVDEAQAAIQRWIDHDTAPVDSPTSRAAIDGALLNLWAARAGRPLHELLAPGSPGSLAVTALVTGSNSEELAEAARQAVTNGHPGVKVKVGNRPFTNDLERISAVRTAIGNARLRIDANGAWGIDESVDHLKRLASLDIEFVEEPTSGVEALAAVRHSSPVPIAIDESAADLQSIHWALEVGAADVLILKPSALGGPRVTAKAARQASEIGLKVVVTSLLEGSVGIRSAAQLTSAMGLVDPAPGLATATLLAADPGDPFIPENGLLTLD